MDGARVLVVGVPGGPARVWGEALRDLAADVAAVRDGADALRHLELIEPDVILIDRGSNGAFDGFETCRALRSATGAGMVIVAPEARPHDEIVALAVGADRFLLADTPLELVTACLHALLRRTRVGVAVRGGSAPTDLAGTLVDGDLLIDLEAREVMIADERVELTRIEFDLLAALALRPRQVLTREQLMTAAWEVPVEDSHTLDTHLSRLRCKIASAGGGRVAHAVRGVGYRLRDRASA